MAQDKVELTFKQSLLGTFLVLIVEENSLVIKSDNLSSLAIMKESFTQETNSRKVEIKTHDQQLVDSVSNVIDILDPMVMRQYEIAQKYQLIEGLKEITTGEQDTSFLSEEYREILQRADIIQKQYNDQPKMLAFLWSVIADLFGDSCKINGRHNVGDQLKQLRDLLVNRYSKQSLLEFFKVNLV